VGKSAWLTHASSETTPSSMLGNKWQGDQSSYYRSILVDSWHRTCRCQCLPLHSGCTPRLWDWNYLPRTHCHRYRRRYKSPGPRYRFVHRFH